MPGAISPPSDEAGSSGHADVPKTLAVDAASSDDLVGVAQPDVQQQQETWVKYNSLQEAQLLPEWRQQDSLVANATSGFGKPHVSKAFQQTDSEFPLSASLKIVQAPAAYNRPIVQKKLFKPPFIVRLELQYEGHIDLVVNVIAHVLNDSQCAKPGTWQPLGGLGQADLEGHLLTRRLRVPSASTAAEKQSQLANADTHKFHAEDFEFSELNFVKSSRMSKRWLLFTCFFKEEPISVLYKLPTVVISRRTDQYSKAYEHLMGQVPQQGIPRARAHALPKAPCGAAGAQTPSALLHQYRKSTEGREGLNPTALPSAPDNHDINNRAGDTLLHTEAGAGSGAAHVHGLSPDQQVAAWILQHYASLSFKRALTHTDLAALERRARAGGNSPVIQSKAWDDFQDWFCKTIKALKQCEGEWNEAGPPCMSGFAMDRAAADAALQYEPVGAFLVRMCCEPGLFAISCRTSTDVQNKHLGSTAADEYASAEGAGSVDHVLVDCMDLQRRPLWRLVLACPAATHLLDPSSHRLYPKNQVHHQLAAQLGDPQPAPPPSTMDVDQLLALAAQFPSHNAAAFSNGVRPCPQPHPQPQLHLRSGYAEHQVDPQSRPQPHTTPAASYLPGGPAPHGGIEGVHANSAVADSAAQRGLTGGQGVDQDGKAPDIQPRLKALLASLQAQVAGQSPSVQPPSARPGTASPSQQEEEEEQQQQQQQQQQAEQQQTAEAALGGLQQHLHTPTDWSPGCVNAALQHLLQQSRTPRHWHPDEAPQRQPNSV